MTSKPMHVEDMECDQRQLIAAAGTLGSPPPPRPVAASRAARTYAIRAAWRATTPYTLHPIRAAWCATTPYTLHPIRAAWRATTPKDRAN